MRAFNVLISKMVVGRDDTGVGEGVRVGNVLSPSDIIGNVEFPLLYNFTISC